MLRWNDVERTLDLGVRDVLGARDGRFERGRVLAMSFTGRTRAGQEVHAAVEAERDPMRVVSLQDGAQRTWTVDASGSGRGHPNCWPWRSRSTCPRA